jgi:hypothetical protein
MRSGRDEETMTAVMIWGRWRLREGKQEAELLDLMRNAMIPHYQKYGNRVNISLLRIADSRSYLMLQRWPDRETWTAFPTSMFYEIWFAEYEPILEQWDALMELEEEWECEELL